MVYSDLTQNSECTMFVWKHSFDTPGTTTAAKQQRFFNVAGKVAVVGGIECIQSGSRLICLQLVIHLWVAGLTAFCCSVHLHFLFRCFPTRLNPVRRNHVHHAKRRQRHGW